MLFQPPVLDDRTFQQIVDEVRKRIPLYCPEWTDHNLSDPGVTLIELFAWMTELLIYRLNQVPQLHYIKFAEFLGVQRQSPRAARARITFWLTRSLTTATDPDDTGLTIAEATQISTTQTETKKPIIFTTNAPFKICAPRFQQMLVRKYETDSQVQTPSQGTAPQGHEVKRRKLKALEVQNLRDGHLLPIFSSQPHEGDELCFGFANDLSDHIIRFDFRFREKAGIGINVNYPPYLWEVYADTDNWLPVDAEPDTTKGLNAASGSVTLHLPKLRSHQPDIDPATRDEPLAPYWIRVRIKKIADSEKEQGMREYNETPELLQIVAIAAVGCAVGADNAFVVQNEKLGVSDGSAGQRYQLTGLPVLLPLEEKRERLKVEVPGEDPQYWDYCRDFSAAEPMARLFGIDSNQGEVYFGPAVRQPNGEIRSYGAVPPRGAVLTLERYRYGGGAEGNRPKKVINVLRSSIPYVARVENRYGATGGLDATTLDELSMIVQRHLRTHRAAVTTEDFEALVSERFGNEIALVRCVGLSQADGQLTERRVRILLVPVIRYPGGDHTDVYISNDLLEVDVKLREKILHYLQEFRLLTDRVDVEKPIYQRVKVVAQIKPRSGVDWEPLRQQILRRLYAFFHPVSGGPHGQGWLPKQQLTFDHVKDALKALPGVDTVTIKQLTIGDEELLTPSSEPFKLAETDILIAAKEQEHDIQMEVT